MSNMCNTCCDRGTGFVIFSISQSHKLVNIRYDCTKTVTVTNPSTNCVSGLCAGDRGFDGRPGRKGEVGDQGPVRFGPRGRPGKPGRSGRPGKSTLRVISRGGVLSDVISLSS